MKIFTKKSILQKTILVILTVLCINFIVPTYSSAGIGGVLINPILDFLASVGDIVESLMQWVMTGELAAGEKLSDSNIMVDQDDDRIVTGGSNPAISVSTDELDLGWFTSSDKYQVPIIKYTPEEIFSNKNPYLDINFISPKWTETTSEYGIDGSAAILQKTISGWYIALRNLAIVGLLCVLVYVGIRIIISSTASDKAKYKQMFTDWLVALCILFFLHYIMSFTLVIIDSVNDAIAGGGYSADSVVISVDGTNYTTNIMGSSRFMVQSKSVVERFGYLLIYLALVVYTAIFTWHYLKRLLNMAFLTIIAPLVALTYPIDKIGDGKAQAFNMWLKEYVYTALIQPFHLIIYMVFVGSAMELVKTNFIYAIAAIAFILPAEKLLKKMFGFDKAPLGTMGALSGFTAGSIASKLGKGGKSSSGGGQKGGNTTSSEDNKPPRYDKHHGTEGIDYAENHQLGTGQEDNIRETENNNFDEKARRELEQNDLDTNDKIRDDLGNTDKYAEEQNRYGQFEKQEFAENEARRELEQDNKTGKVDLRQGMRNVISAHGGGKAIAIKGAKTLGKAAKFTAKTAATLGGIGLGVGAGIASGKGIAGIMAGAAAGKAAGSALGNTVANVPGNIAGKTIRAGKAATSTARGTIDTFRGNSKMQDRFEEKEFMKDNATQQYIRDKWTNEHNGMAPTKEQFKEQMENMQPYVKEGMRDVAQIYRAQKAEKVGVSAEQSAKIALLAKDRKITSEVLGDEKKYAAKRQDFTQEFINKGIDKDTAAKKADYVLNVMKAQNGQNHNLKIINNTQTQGGKTTSAGTAKGKTASRGTTKGKTKK